MAKFNPSGTALIYSTFLGGTNNENTRTQRSGRIAVDAAGNAYVAGDTSSTDFPVGGSGADTVFGGGVTGQTDAFYVKLGPTGAFLYGTYMGGIDFDTAVGIGVDSAGNVYVAGSALSDAASFPQTAERLRPGAQRLRRLPDQVRRQRARACTRPSSVGAAATTTT